MVSICTIRAHHQIISDIMAHLSSDLSVLGQCPYQLGSLVSCRATALRLPAQRLRGKYSTPLRQSSQVIPSQQYASSVLSNLTNLFDVVNDKHLPLCHSESLRMCRIHVKSKSYEASTSTGAITSSCPCLVADLQQECIDFKKLLNKTKNYFTSSDPHHDISKPPR